MRLPHSCDSTSGFRKRHVGIHPLLERAAEPAVRQSRGFREAAEAMTGEALAEEFAASVAHAPQRAAAGKRYFPKRQRVPRRAKPEELILAALVHRHRDEPLERPDGGTLRLLDYQVPLQARTPDKNEPDDPNHGIGRAALLGMSDSGRLVVFEVKLVEPDSRRTKTGDTPLRALLEGLTKSAVLHANRESVAAEIAERFDLALDTEHPPEVVILGTPQYWALCRQREAQKGAAWIQQMERLAKELGEVAAPPTHYWGIAIVDYPGFEVSEDAWPQLGAPARLERAWDEYAGRVRPKPKRRPKPKTAPEEEVVEADLSRPVRSYGMNETYFPGDRIDHPSLGLGVVQGVAGPSKVRVRFDDQTRVLVHARPD